MPAFTEAALRVSLIAHGSAVDYLRDRGITPIELGGSDEKDLLHRYSPRVVLVGTSENLDTLALRLIAAARERRVPSIAIVDQAANAEHRFRGRSADPMAFAPDLLLLRDEESAAAFARLGFARDRLLVVGNPHFDRVRAAASSLSTMDRAELRRRLFPQAPAERPIVVFLAEIGYVVNAEGPLWEANLNFSGRGGTRYRTAVVLEEVLDSVAALSPRPWLVLRLHPKNRLDEFHAYIGELDQISAGGDPLPLIWAANLVVGMTSSLVEEAFIMGRPVLSVLPHDVERSWLPSVARGEIRTVSSREQLVRSLRELLQQRDTAGPKLLGDAGSRIVSCIIVSCIKDLMAAQPVVGN